MADLDGAGGAKTFSFDFFNDTSIANFGAFGTGGTPADPSELDTLAFGAKGLTAANMILIQHGTSVVSASMASRPESQITLENMTIEQLGNIAGQGNFRFFGEPPSPTAWISGAPPRTDRPVHTRHRDLSQCLDNNVSGFGKARMSSTALPGTIR